MSFPIPPITNIEVHDTILHTLVVIDGITPFIRMDMACDDGIDSVPERRREEDGGGRREEEEEG